MVGIKKVSETTAGQDEVLKTWVGKGKQDSWDPYSEEDSKLLDDAALSAGWYIDMGDGKYYIRKYREYGIAYDTYEDALIACGLYENGVEDAQGNQDQ